MYITLLRCHTESDGAVDRKGVVMRGGLFYEAEAKSIDAGHETVSWTGKGVSYQFLLLGEPRV